MEEHFSNIPDSNKINSREAFSRKVNRDAIPTCNILGVNIAAVNLHFLLNYLEENVKNKAGNQLAGDYICVSNVHTTIISYDDIQYLQVQNGGLMAIPDGGPLSTIGRIRGYENISRTTGPDLMNELFTISVTRGYTHYFYGSTEETLERMRSELKKKYPGIQIVGMYSPPFRPLTVEEDETIIEHINQTKPDFIWVGLGAPKQEKWMAAHQGKVAGLMVGVGAGFDYFAGNIDRAPNWMQKINMEWFYRLLQDPKRLFKRYMYTNIKFIWLAVIRGK
ncbi:glycosyl transferase [Priestia megaterium]|uniref:WecB/TagA/CpsF family glycosyltransferase n=1 Tax=Priestia megaterium TaxID=1404 RepID=UPI000BF34F56|nr:WecB/TagA/CpsF family glycosyltransferase [Priestia megaterium]PEX10215.1 glycosyl transferase [Priestia megaterium]